MRTVVSIIAVAVTAFLAACGGGGDVRPLPYKTAVLSFNAVSSAHSAPLQGLEITVKLPQGASVGSVSNDLKGKSGTLDYGSAVYSSTDNTVSFRVFGNPISFGTFAELTCGLTADLAENSFTSLNSPRFPVLTMYGVANGSTQALTIPVTMSVRLQ